MADQWYETVEANVPLTQGDIILDCPVIGWRDDPLVENSAESLQGCADAFAVDVVVMTQACDLEQGKLRNVVLCPNQPLSEYKTKWEQAMRLAQQNPTSRAWKRHCENLCDGQLWNLTILNRELQQPLQTEHRIVDFHEVYTAPRQFLESFIRDRNKLRLRLLPPYREHLSQAFARFFMRVGLPTVIEPGW